MFTNSFLVEVLFWLPQKLKKVVQVRLPTTNTSKSLFLTAMYITADAKFQHKKTTNKLHSVIKP